MDLDPLAQSALVNELLAPAGAALLAELAGLEPSQLEAPAVVARLRRGRSRELVGLALDIAAARRKEPKGALIVPSVVTVPVGTSLCLSVPSATVRPSGVVNDQWAATALMFAGP